MTRQPKAVTSALPWSRTRLLATAVGVAATVVLTLLGVGFALVQAFTSAATPDATMPAAGVRDRVAAEPMIAVPAEAASAGVPALRLPEPIRVEEPAVLRGPAGVTTGFPHTPEGAVGQLAAIEVVVVEAMDLDVTRTVYEAWVEPGGPPFEGWVLTRAVQAFLASSEQPGLVKSVTTVVRARPAAGIVKGADGPDWVVACVLLDVHAVVRVEARVGFGHCERMAWRRDRWVITAGTPPAMAPSTLPGTQAAADAGWRPWPGEGRR